MFLLYLIKFRERFMVKYGFYIWGYLFLVLDMFLIRLRKLLGKEVLGYRYLIEVGVKFLFVYIFLLFGSEFKDILGFIFFLFKLSFLLQV